MSVLRSRSSYQKTVKNLRIDQDTRVMYQGFTGQAATSNARETIDYGTNVVGGVSPGKGGCSLHLGLPVFSSVGEATEKIRPQVSAVFVPAQFAAKAIIESIEAEVPLVVSVAEHMPVHDLMRVHEVLACQDRTRLLGPNSPGIISPGRCRVGIMPFRQYRRGCVGIVSKSGTLSYEAVGATSAVGLGQSLVVAIGGDSMPGTSMVDALSIFFSDDDATEGIILIGEIGGEEELRAAELIGAYRRTVVKPKPVIAMVAGLTAPRGRTMGHAGAILTPRDATAGEKADALRGAGAVVVAHPGEMGVRMRELLGK
ncbi:succinate-CoA ligase (alpha subunit) [Ophiocordyceps camponoti-floridani]|uniref:Succinate-CoA ligase (Alpha subunit) n=1 Tax=Ophiocordyceps camponoti-floridani TaxID=2030778 RepID=A0A8H4QAQ0_9HYPO|nr:succinate-CoA ligase (alpha subunit) [Ophiocordyceps camponoti-floridani]